MNCSDYVGVSVTSAQNGLTCSVSLLPIYSIVQGHEKIARELVSNKRDGSWQVVRILSPEIPFTSIFFIRTIDSIEMLSLTNSPVGRAGHTQYYRHMGGLVQLEQMGLIVVILVSRGD